MAFVTANRGRLVLDFSWKKVRCREYLGLPDNKEGRGEARQIRKQIEGEVAARTFDYSKWFPEGRKRELFAPPPENTEPVPTFAAFAREWLENKKAWFAPATYYDRKRIIEGKLIQFFGDDQAGDGAARLVSTIRLEDVERLINTVKAQKGIHGAKLSNRRANMILDVLRQILDRALLRGWLGRNPARAVPKLREDAAQIDPFSFKELKALLGKGFRSPEMRRYFTVAFFTGLRPSEQVGAQWDAVDWVSAPPLLGVVAAVTRGGRGRTKTPGSKRWIELQPIVQQALRAQRATSQHRSPHIFASRTGGPLDITNLRERVWKPALRRAKLRYRTMYQTRHTFATLALQSGEQLGWVSKQLGHTTDEMVIRHYAKFIPNLTRKDGSALAKVMNDQGLR